MDLFWLKLIHTAIAVVNASAVFYILYCGLRDRQGLWLNAAFVILAVECVSLALGGGECPLQIYARRLEGSDDHVHDIFLPEWMAQNIMTFFTPITVIAIALVLRNAWRRRRASVLRNGGEGENQVHRRNEQLGVE